MRRDCKTERVRATLPTLQWNTMSSGMEGLTLVWGKLNVGSYLYKNRATATIVIGKWLSSIKVQKYRWCHYVVWLARVIRIHIASKCCRQKGFQNSRGHNKKKNVQLNLKSKVRNNSPNNVQISRHLTGLKKLEVDSDWFKNVESYKARHTLGDL